MAKTRKPIVSEKDAPKKVGRPPAKIRLKPDPKTSKEKYYRLYGDLGVCCVYGIDEFTDELIDYLWKKPEMTFIVTDPVETIIANTNRKYGARSFSMYRWDMVHHQGFIEQAQGLIVVVASKYYDTVRKLPRAENVKLVVLEDLS